MHFYFHLHECGTVTYDNSGAELAELSDAREMAIHEARIVMCSEAKTGRLCLDCHIEIADGSGRELDVVWFKDAVTVRGGKMAACH